MKLHLEPTTIRQLGYFLVHVRDEDLVEAELSGEKEFIDNYLVELTSSCSLVDEQGRVFAIGGIRDNTVWMLCTKHVEENKVAFLRFTKKLLKDVMVHYPYLHNYVYVNNKLHVDWLTWMGAEWGDYIKDNQFRYFIFRKETFNV